MIASRAPDKRHTLTAIKYGYDRGNGERIIMDKIEEKFLSIYNLERRQRHLEEGGYETVVNRVTEAPVFKEEVMF